jgi:hypothetical protein
MVFLGAGLRAAKQVALGDNAEHGALVVCHREAADTVLKHQLGRLLDRRVWPHSNHKRRHQISRVHGRAPRLLENYLTAARWH